MKDGSKTSKFGTVARLNHDSSLYYDSKLYEELSQIDPSTLGEDRDFPEKLKDTIIMGNAENMDKLPDNSVHLMVTSPPYNASKEYDEDLSLSEYMEMLRKVFSETYRVLVNGGRACVNIANLGRRPYIPLSDFVSHTMLDIGFRMRGEIIWNKGAGAGVSMAWGSFKSASNPVLRDIHEYILVFSKGDFKRPNSKDRESTITKDQFMQWTKSIWEMNTESAKRVGHPAPFPIELPHRFIQLYTFQNDIILDPFMGSGTTALAAIKSKRSYIGYEIDPEYIELAEKRIKPLKAQTQMEF